MKEDELVAWIAEHADLVALCRIGGWPDEESLEIRMCGHSDQGLEVDVSFIEVLQEMSECEPCRHERRGRFFVTLTEHGSPASIRLLYPM